MSINQTIHAYIHVDYTKMELSKFLNNLYTYNHDSIMDKIYNISKQDLLQPLLQKYSKSYAMLNSIQCT